MKKILLTGASGFLGRVLCRHLQKAGCYVLGLGRHGAPEGSESDDWIQADLTDPGSLMRDEVFKKIRDIDVIIHAAALYDLTASHLALYEQNVVATSNILQIARLLPRAPHVCITSTIAVAGDFIGTFTEEMADVSQEFPDAYGSTKFAAEQMVRSARDIPSRSIVRLGVLVGSSKDGWINKIDGLYYIQRLFKEAAKARHFLEKFPFLPMPFNENSRMFLVPVDMAAQGIYEILNKYSAIDGLKVYHLTGESGGIPIRLALTHMLSYYDLDLNIAAISQRLVPGPIFGLLNIPSQVRSYMNHEWSFDDSEFRKDFPKFSYPNFREYASKIFEYADQNLFQSRGRV